ncbi:hypothetical protein [Neptunomonas japonica]|uniref:Uncharacterized protein n=1 Tax=Neptunomonas japonica JAMM 1380 TaxID=1441457 RepID=A0A7R6P830_9GAMM|nr:hypothetical protein [Neptunomonas japonica]BBB28998.1 hypothetical protein NEJAP_1041 [Neptunomonas japonica JAMM 1380]
MRYSQLTSQPLLLAMMYFCIAMLLTSCSQEEEAPQSSVTNSNNKAEVEVEAPAVVTPKPAPPATDTRQPSVKPSATVNTHTVKHKPKALPTKEAAGRAKEAQKTSNTTTLNPKYKDATKEISPPTFDQYKVEITANTRLDIPGPVGELRVWIGNPDSGAIVPAGMASSTTTIPAAGETAKIEAIAPEFNITPKNIQCIKIHPKGSELSFILVPIKAGTFQVGANINLFESADCSGIPVPRTAATLNVTVNVDSSGLFKEKLIELLSVFWKKLLEFWETLLVSIFGIILFLAKDKLKLLFGKKDDT